MRYVLGGSRIADAFSMMEAVLGSGAADRCLTCGLNGEVMVLARGTSLGLPSERLIDEKGLTPFIEKAKELDAKYGEKIISPLDFAIDDGGRKEIGLDQLPSDHLLVDIGPRTIEVYESEIGRAATIFVNGPAGIYEKAESAEGTRRLWTAVADAPVLRHRRRRQCGGRGQVRSARPDGLCLHLGWRHGALSLRAGAPGRLGPETSRRAATGVAHALIGADPDPAADSLAQEERLEMLLKEVLRYQRGNDSLMTPRPCSSGPLSPRPPCSPRGPTGGNAGCMRDRPDRGAERPRTRVRTSLDQIRLRQLAGSISMTEA